MHHNIFKLFYGKNSKTWHRLTKSFFFISKYEPISETCFSSVVFYVIWTPSLCSASRTIERICSSGGTSRAFEDHQRTNSPRPDENGETSGDPRNLERKSLPLHPSPSRLWWCLRDRAWHMYNVCHDYYVPHGRTLFGSVPLVGFGIHSLLCLRNQPRHEGHSVEDSSSTARIVLIGSWLHRNMSCLRRALGDFD